MPGSKQRLKFKRIIASSPAEIYHAFTRRMGLCEWLCDSAQIDDPASGNLYLAWKSGYHVAGTFTRLVPDEIVSFTWLGRGEPGVSKVRVKIQALKEENAGDESGRTVVSITHILPTDTDRWSRTAKELRKGWKKALKNLISILESGEDLRITQRPLLGFSGLRELTVADTGLPVANGILISGIVEGMGASKAGLQPGDILVKAGGVDLITMGDLRSAVQKHQAGDMIKIAYFRQEEKAKTTLSLSAMPVPALPGTPAELIGKLEKDHKAALKSLFKLLNGVSPEEASFRPKAGEWNILEVLAHMLVGERAIHTWINGLATGRGSMEIPFYYANEFSMQAAIKAYGSPRALFLALNRHTKETIQMLRSLPAEIVARKSTYWRIAVNLIDMPDHTCDHLKQITALLEEARATGVKTKINI